VWIEEKQLIIASLAYLQIWSVSCVLEIFCGLVLTEIPHFSKTPSPSLRFKIWYGSWGCSSVVKYMLIIHTSLEFNLQKLPK
jgi:hypothetical protein